MSSRKRQPAAERKADARREELGLEATRTEYRLQNLQRQHAELVQAIKDNENAQNQMLGRLRYIQEGLGLVPPMADAEQVPVNMEEEVDNAVVVEP